jgi:hypothetical protein
MIPFRHHCLFLILPCILLYHQAYSQKFFPKNKEIGVLVGGSNYHGDLAREIVPSETGLMLGAYYGRNFNEWVTGRAQLSYGQISGSDDNFDIYQNRNLHFFSHVAEFSATMELNFLPYGTNPNLRMFSPYVFIGLGLFHYTPKTRIGDVVHNLHRLNTEGQGLVKEKYSLIQPCMPLGFGLKVKQSQNILVGLEIGFRKTWTDYLDDVSGDYPNYELMVREKGSFAAQMSHRYKDIDPSVTVSKGHMRGDPHLNDWYFFLNLRLAYQFGRPPCAGPYSF